MFKPGKFKKGNSARIKFRKEPDTVKKEKIYNAFMTKFHAAENNETYSSAITTHDTEDIILVKEDSKIYIKIQSPLDENIMISLQIKKSPSQEEFKKLVNKLIAKYNNNTGRDATNYFEKGSRFTENGNKVYSIEHALTFLEEEHTTKEWNSDKFIIDEYTDLL
jgi:hypothetical protein